MADGILVSICIPAYKRIDFLQRLLDSIQIQTFRNFEVIVTDDSPDSSVKNLCDQYQQKFPLRYFRNQKPLGTPENWNEAIRQSEAAWIKLMHDDDWFTDADSLRHFMEATDKKSSLSFIFSAYQNIYFDGRGPKKMFPDRSLLKTLNSYPAILLAGNCIGPPSTVLHKKNNQILYDGNMKWLVDIDFFIRQLSVTQAVYIPDVLVNIGISENQVTNNAFRNREIEIPENFLLLKKTGTGILKNIRVFDAWWRLIRNLKIRSEADIRSAGYKEQIPAKIKTMINFQQRIPHELLQVGLISKICMFICFLFANENRDH